MNKKLSVTMEDLEQLFDKKLKPIKDDISQIKNVAEKMNERMNKSFKVISDKLERLEEINLAHIEDFGKLEFRIKRLEKSAATNN